MSFGRFIVEADCTVLYLRNNTNEMTYAIYGLSVGVEVIWGDRLGSNL